MAQKRMFDRAIIDTDRFMDLGMTAKAFYFLLGMEADDEGFVSYKKVMRIHGGNEDDMKVLTVKGFILHFPSGVVVITDWHSNNYLDSRRLRPTEYQDEKKMLVLTDSNKYEFSQGLASIEEKRGEESSTEYRQPLTIEQVVDEDKPQKVRKSPTDLKGFETFWNLYPNKKNKVGASAVWRTLSEQDRTVATSDVGVRIKSSDWKKDEGKFIPMPENYLKNKRWTDEGVKVVTNNKYKKYARED